MTHHFPQAKEQVKFAPTAAGDFYPVVKKRVEEYFQKHNLSRHANREMWVKTALLLMAYVATYALVLVQWPSFWLTLLFFMLLGTQAALIGFNIIHDALHNAYSSERRYNRWIGYLFDLNGMSSALWILVHNQQHHTYTNITGLDQDIDKMIWLRLSPYDGHYWFHRYQHWYALPLYCLSSLNWCHWADYQQFWQAWRQGRASNQEAGLFLIFKALNWVVFFIIPLLVLSWPWWQIVIAYIAMHAAGGLFSALVFQLAHIVEGVDYPLPDREGHMHEQWAEHEVRTAANFATHNYWVGALIGGLNYQIEHHLFPKVCHTHYPAIAPIIRTTIREFDLPYCEKPTFWQALSSHLRTLRWLGQGSCVKK